MIPTTIPLKTQRRAIAGVALSLVLISFTGAGERLLFLDPALVRDQKGVTLRVQAPERSEPVILVDRPWEARMISFYTTVIDEEGRLRMWYICRDAENRPNVAYAESRDGRNWTKPNLGIVEYRGSKENNLVGLTSLDGAVFKDPNGAPSERYVYVAHVADRGVFRFTSPDGLRWRRDERALLPFRADTQNVVTWDEARRRYAVYLRAWDVGEVWNQRMRKVARLELPTLAVPAGIKPGGRGSNPERASDLPRIADEVPTVLAADARDPANTDVYNLSAQPYPLDPRWLVGFPSFFRRDKNISDGRLEVQFVASRDGVSWERFDRAPFVRPGLSTSPSANMTFIGPGIVVRGEELWLFGTGFRHRHGDVGARRESADGTIYRHVLRTDGFVALELAREGGACVVGPLKIVGSRLRLNLDTSALGELRVGLRDVAGNELSGFEATRCLPLQINSTGADVTWSGSGNVASLAGREVYLALSGRGTNVFSAYSE